MHVVIFREGPYWLAQALEHDIGVQAENLKDLLVRLDIALAAEESVRADLPPAPKYFQDLWPVRAGDFHPDPAHARHLEPPMEIRFGIVA